MHIRECSGPAAALLLACSAVAAADDWLARIKPVDEARARDAGLRLVERYPSFLLMAGNAVVDAPGLELEMEPDGYRLALPYGSASDPQQLSPWQPQGRAPLPRDLVLLQFVGPTQPAWMARLEAAGVPVLAYLHPYTYLVWNGDGAVDTALDTLEAVRWAGAWPQSARIAATLDQRSAGPASVRLLSWRGAGTHRAAEWSALGAKVDDVSERDPVYTDTRLIVSGLRLSQLAALPGVVSIQPVPVDGGLRGEISNQQFAGNVGADNLPLPDYRNWLAQFKLDGLGVLMANVDAGVDTSHPNLASRFVSCTGSTCGLGASSSHGTHTAGIMAADGSDNIRNAGNFVRGLGVSFAAHMVEQKNAPFFQQAGGMLLLMQESTQNGALLSNNSWGPSGSPRGYDSDTRQVDIGVRDADAALAGDQPLIYVLSIMNGFGGVSSQGTPDEAKNTITVGSTRSQIGVHSADTQWRNLSDSTGHGPALDGRRIPHLVAPGCSVDSTISGGYELMCGTSQAAPHVSGAAALFAQGYKRRTGVFPSPALTRAAMIAATVDLQGFSDADGVVLGHRPDSKQGWGALRLGGLLDLLAEAEFFDQATVFSATGQSWSTTLYPRDATKPIQIVLSYTDAPGHGTCGASNCTTPAWNNDLNLSATVAATSFLGNVFNAQGLSTTGGSADHRNNTEAVLLAAGQPVNGFTVTVTAANINSDALPNLAGSLQQDFALVCSNCQANPPPLLADGFE